MTRIIAFVNKLFNRTFNRQSANSGMPLMLPSWKAIFFNKPFAPADLSKWSPPMIWNSIRLENIRNIVQSSRRLDVTRLTIELDLFLAEAEEDDKFRRRNFR